MLSAIAKPFGWLMLFLYNFVNDYGIAIFLFALIVRLILMPFSAKSKKSLLRTSRLQPLMKELEKKHGAGTQKYQEEVAKLYKEEKINPMSGCLWTLIPFPILIALYQAIRFPITVMMNVGDEAYAKIQEVLTSLGFVMSSGDAAYGQIAESQFITNHFEQFAGISDKLQKLDYTFLGMDLGATPSYRVWEFFSNGQEVWPQLGLFLIPVISALLSYLSMVISNKMSGNTATENTSASANTKTMTLIMPLVSLWIGFAMPGALGLYWIASSVFTMLQDAVLTRHYKKIVDAEDAAYREKQEALEAERAAKRAETEKLRAAGATTTNPNTSKRTLARMEKQKAEENDVERAIARGELKRTSSGKLVPTGKEAKEKANPSAVGDRPYARGRNYKPDRFSKNYVPEPEEDESLMPQEQTDVTESTEGFSAPAEADAEAVDAVVTSENEEVVGTAGTGDIPGADVITAGEIGSENEDAAEEKENTL